MKPIIQDNVSRWLPDYCKEKQVCNCQPSQSNSKYQCMPARYQSISMARHIHENNNSNQTLMHQQRNQRGKYNPIQWF